MSPHRIEFTRPDGATCPALLVEPAQAHAPGLVLIQEWWGLNAQITATAERLAAEGYRVLVPDLYRGRLATAADEASHLMNALDFADACDQDLAGARAWLAESGSPQVGVMGFCMGGALTVAAAARLGSSFAAAVCFYGVRPAAFADPARIAIPFQAHFATQDDWCTPAVAAQLESAMRAAGQQPEIHHYDAQHAFFNASRPEVFDAGCANLAWQRTLAFLGAQLGA
jgi:carboxymethylenebutenolidase